VARRDLNEIEIYDLRVWAKQQSPRERDLIERLCGEVKELRDREAGARVMQDLEQGEW
jgi:hypothetical protein